MQMELVTDILRHSLFRLTSPPFLLFLLVMTVVYYSVHKKHQWKVLLAGNALFIGLYAGIMSVWQFALPLAVYLAASLIIYSVPIIIQRAGAERKKRAALIAGIACLSLLFVLFRLANSFILTINGFLPDGWRLSPISFSWIAPVGIAYFLLSGIGYIVDVYWEKYPAERSFARVALIAGFFPALVSGPIVRYDKISESLFTPHSFDYQKFKFGAERVIYGFFKKLVIADRASAVTGALFGNPETTAVPYIFGLFLFALQLYSDFSGCMDIMLGTAEILQIELPENFRRPFFARNLSEFWRRWHITLGLWAKDYIMYPLLKSKPFFELGVWCRKKFGRKLGKTIPSYVAMLALWIIIGLWHGGAPKYVFSSGILLWITIVGGQLLQPAFDKLSGFLRINRKSGAYGIFCNFRTLCLMCFAWLFFSADTLTSGAKAFIRIIRTFPGDLIHTGASAGHIIAAFKSAGYNLYDILILMFGFAVLLTVGILTEKMGFNVRQKLQDTNIAVEWFVLFFFIFFVIIFGIYGPGYNVADFIYNL